MTLLALVFVSIDTDIEPDRWPFQGSLRVVYRNRGKNWICEAGYQLRRSASAEEASIGLKP
jgi:hypothetical protein